MRINFLRKNREKIKKIKKRVLALEARISSIENMMSYANPFEQSLESYQNRYALSLEEIAQDLPEIRTDHVDLKREDFEAFLEQYLPWHEAISELSDHKKKLELFSTFHFLGAKLLGVYLDAAGGGFSYAGTIQADRTILQDMEIRETVRERSGAHVEYVESSLTGIPLDDCSVDAISTHHSFEHFQGSADSDFIVEAQRILKPGGMLALVPLFIARNAIEMTNFSDFSNWSISEKHRVFDPNATLPGKKSGNFARIYDTTTFRERVLSKVDPANFDLALTELTLEGRPIPDPITYHNHKVSNFNYPYRLLTMTKKG